VKLLADAVREKRANRLHLDWPSRRDANRYEVFTYSKD